MPLIVENSYWAVWHISEAEDDLRASLPSADQAALAVLKHPTRRLEWLAARRLAQHLAQAAGHAYEGMDKDEFGRPWLINCPRRISLSHAFPRAAALLSPPERPHASVGIDLERARPEVARLAPRFLHPDELAAAHGDVAALRLLWSAKEALYKLYGERQLDLRRDLRVAPFRPAPRGSLQGRIVPTGQEITLYYEQNEAYTIVAGVG